MVKPAAYALITHMRLLRERKPVYDVYSLNTTGLQCVRFSQHQSSTDLHAVACNLGKLNVGAKFVHLIVQRAYPQIQLII